MPKQLDPKIVEVLKEHGFGREAVWDCHGVTVVYHRVLEQIAASAGIAFDQPHIVEANSKEKIAVVCVTGRMGDRCEWSIGEAAPGNNKNSYPWAMAEKRAKDRVILKIIGLHGLVYSEEEADDFKGARSDPMPEPEHNRGRHPDAAPHVVKENNRYTGLSGPHKTKVDLQNALKAIVHDLEGMTDEQELDGFLKDNVMTIHQLQKDFPGWWDKERDETNDFEGLKQRIERIRERVRKEAA